MKGGRGWVSSPFTKQPKRVPEGAERAILRNEPSQSQNLEFTVHAACRFKQLALSVYAGCCGGVLEVITQLHSKCASVGQPQRSTPCSRRCKGGSSGRPRRPHCRPSLCKGDLHIRCSCLAVISCNDCFIHEAFEGATADCHCTLYGS